MSNKKDSFVEPINALLVPVATSAGQTLKDVWDFIFGAFHLLSEKRRFLEKNDLQSFKSMMEKGFSGIPKERICEPPISIIGPALEASKYYFEESEIREMFVNLIIASMDSQYAESVHPFFIEAIKQLSPRDARNLTFFFPKPLRRAIGEYQIKSGVNSVNILQKNVFVADPMASDISQQATSISNLIRLGLLETDYSCVVEDLAYTGFTHTEKYREMVEHCERWGGTPYIKKGVVMLTPLGEKFCFICLSNK